MSDPNILDKVGKVMLQAADVIEERGWTTYALENQRGEVCLLGALNIAARGNPWWGSQKEIDASRIYAERMGFRDLDAVVAWNNTIARTKEEVVAKLREGARRV